MRFASVCSGIEAASVAWNELGWKAQWFSEIEPFPCKVLDHHYGSGRPEFTLDPDEEGLSGADKKVREGWKKAVAKMPAATGIPNLGDMTQIHKSEVFKNAAVDVLIGGTPCQSFSVAGLREGLADPRGNLALTYLALADRKRPRWLVWENVPGVFSSGDGEDFRSILSGFVRWNVPLPEGGWQNSGIINPAPVDGAYGVAWRVLDGQYFGVAQRRRRVFVIGFIGDWRPAAAVLFEQHCMQGHPAPRRSKGEGFARPTAPSLTASGCGVRTTGEGRGQDPVVASVVPALTTRPYGDGDADEGKLISFHSQQSVTQRIRFDHDTTQTLDASKARGLAVAIPMQRIGKGTGRSTDDVTVGLGVGNDGDAMYTLTATEQHGIAHTLRAEGFDASEDGTGRGIPLVVMGELPEVANCLQHRDSKGADSDTKPGHLIAVAIHENQRGELRTTDIAGTLKTHGGKPGQGYQAVMQSDGGELPLAVRRLTPTECERLMAFPDGYTLIPPPCDEESHGNAGRPPLQGTREQPDHHRHSLDRPAHPNVGGR